MEEAREVLLEKRSPKICLGVRLAKRLNKVLRHLPDDFQCNDIDWKKFDSCPEIGAGYHKVFNSLTRAQKSAFVRAFSGVYSKTVGEVRNTPIKGLIGWKCGKVTAAFFKMALQKG